MEAASFPSLVVFSPCVLKLVLFHPDLRGVDYQICSASLYSQSELKFLWFVRSAEEVTVSLQNSVEMMLSSFCFYFTDQCDTLVGYPVLVRQL